MNTPGKPYRAELIVSPDRLRALQPAWNALNALSGDAGLFLSHDAVEASWLRWHANRRMRLHVLAVFDASSQMVMAVPMLRRRDALLTSKLLWLGSGTPLYDDALVHPQADLVALGALFRAHIDSLHFCRRLKIDFILEGSDLHGLLDAAGIETVSRTVASGRSITGVGNGDGYLATLSTNSRQKCRWNRNRIERLGGYHLEVSINAGVAARELERIFAKRREWVLARPDFDPWIVPLESEVWFQTFTKAAAIRGEVRTLILRRGETWLASLVCFVRGKTAFLSKFAHNTKEELHSPGIMIIHEAIRLAADEGLDLVDFMIGRSWWKDRLATGSKAVLKCSHRLPFGALLKRHQIGR